MAKPYQGLALLGVYLLFVLKLGPEWMKNRPAFNLEKILLVYNAIQIYLCAKIFVGVRSPLINYYDYTNPIANTTTAITNSESPISSTSLS